MKTLGLGQKNAKPKTIFQNLGVNHIEEESDEEPEKNNEEVRKHLEKMSRKMNLKNEMEVRVTDRHTTSARKS